MTEQEYEVTVTVTLTEGQPRYWWRVWVDNKKVRGGYCYSAKKANRKGQRVAKRIAKDLGLGVDI